MSDTPEKYLSLVSFISSSGGRPPPSSGVATPEGFSGGGSRSPAGWNLAEIRTEEEFLRFFRESGQLPALGKINGPRQDPLSWPVASPEVRRDFGLGASRHLCLRVLFQWTLRCRS